jgi:hypothetical protein
LDPSLLLRLHTPLFAIRKAAPCSTFQNLTSLNEYCALTHAEPVGIVAGEWSKIGMALPAGSEPLAGKKANTVSDAFLCFSDRVLANETAVAEHCLECLASIYKLLPRPETVYFDWPHPRRRRFTPWINRGVALNELAAGALLKRLCRRGRKTARKHGAMLRARADAGLIAGLIVRALVRLSISIKAFRLSSAATGMPSGAVLVNKRV